MEGLIHVRRTGRTEVRNQLSDGTFGRACHPAGGTDADPFDQGGNDGGAALRVHAVHNDLLCLSKEDKSRESYRPRMPFFGLSSFSEMSPHDRPRPGGLVGRFVGVALSTLRPGLSWTWARQRSREEGP